MPEHNKIDSTWKEFLISIESFIEKRNRYIQSKELTYEALNLYLKLPNVKVASLFLLNKSTFDFNFEISSPSDSEIISKEIYETALETGGIGIALETGKAFINSKQEEGQYNYIIIPLADSTGITGIILLVHEQDVEDYEQVTLRLLSMLGVIISSHLENAKILKDLEQHTLVLEQRIAARTMDLNQSQRELETIFNAVHSGIIVIDERKECIIRANPKACEMLKVEESEILDKNSELFIPLPDPGLQSNSNNSDLSKNFESLIIDRDNKQIPILRTIKRIAYGNEKYRVESFIDITEQKNAERSLLKSNEILELKVEERTEDLRILIDKLQTEIAEREHAENEVRKMLAKEKELNELKSRFVSMISHEFRTPLTIIKSSAQMLNKFGMNLNYSERFNYQEKISKTVDYMTDLIENVIFIGKSDSMQKSVNPNKVDIIEFCNVIITDFKLTLKKDREIILKHSLDSAVIEQDEKLLKLILNNLLSNAAKYSDENSKIEFGLEIEQENVIFTIRDFGIGIPEEQQKNIFDVFYRANNVGNINGTGLGLSVIKESLELLEGKIGLKSIVSEGTEFTVTIPLIRK